MAQRPRVGYLGPAGTFTEEALLASAAPGAVEPVALPTIHETVLALVEGRVEWAVVPIENSLDGSVSVTLDLLGEEAAGVEIVGEALLSVRHSLIACGWVELGAIDTVLTHPQVPGQCRRFLHGELAHATVLPASSTAEAVRTVARQKLPAQAALGTALAAEIYGATVLREGVQDRDDNETRFVWLASHPAPREAGDTGLLPPLRAAAGGPGWKTSLVFWGPGADSPGWLVRCLDEFGRRAINLTKIESRPKRERLGSYMFFVDLQGRAGESPVAEAIAGLSAICRHARVLGSYPSAARARTSDAGVEAGASGAQATGSANRHGRSAPSLHSGAADG